MTLKDLNISQCITVDKSPSEVSALLTKYKDRRKIKLSESGLFIYGKTFYNYEFLKESTNLKITVIPKKIMVVIHVVFLVTWAIVGGMQTSWIFSILSLIGIVLFGAFVHKGLMTECAKELVGLIED